MNVLDHFSVPFKGLKNGVHAYKFDIDDAFFAAYENAYINKGRLEGSLSLDKRSDLAVATLVIRGKVELPCDRCLKDLYLDVKGDSILHIKFGVSDEEYDEVLFIDPEASHINFADFVYDCVCLSLPMVRVHEDESLCDPDMIAKLHANKSTVKVENVFAALQGLNLKEEEE
jgi:uncharacterized metal-binding protein YceD (DUF177 family)